jgi:hypothetical protein
MVRIVDGDFGHASSYYQAPATANSLRELSAQIVEDFEKLNLGQRRTSPARQKTVN